MRWTRTPSVTSTDPAPERTAALRVGDDRPRGRRGGPDGVGDDGGGRSLARAVARGPALRPRAARARRSAQRRRPLPLLAGRGDRRPPRPPPGPRPHPP